MVFTHQLCACCCLAGLPKAALVDQNRLLSALAIISAYGVKSKDVMYINLPLYHTAGFLVGFLGCIETGGNTEKLLTWVVFYLTGCKLLGSLHFTSFLYFTRFKELNKTGEEPELKSYVFFLNYFSHLVKNNENHKGLKQYTNRLNRFGAKMISSNSR